MDGGFGVDPARLRRVSARLGECGERLGAVAGRLAALGAAGASGHAGLDAACREFGREWRGGLRGTAALTAELREGLDAALGAYERAERGVSGVMAGRAGRAG